MTPRDVRAMVEAKRELRRQDREFLDQLQAHQTAMMINVWCGTSESPAPASPEDCMAFIWNQQEEDDDDEDDNFGRTMDMWVRATKGRFSE